MTEADRARVYRQGRRRLLDWMPGCRARALMNDDFGRFDARSAVAQAQFPHIRERNLDALVIMPGEQGGWVADLLLKNVPPGVANALGTPVQSPHATEQEAEEAGRRLLEMVLFQAHQNEKTPEPALEDKTVVFELYRYAITLPGRVLSEAAVIMPDMAHGYGSRMHAEERIQAVLAEVLPGEDHATFDFSTLDAEPLARICAVLVGAALAGMFRYPEIAAKPPGPSCGKEGRT